MIFYGYGYGEDIIYFMLHQRRMAIEENKTAVQIDQYEYLKKKLMIDRTMMIIMELLNMVMTLQIVKLFTIKIQAESVSRRF